jgi:preprotein translocase subunit SecY
MAGLFAQAQTPWLRDIADFINRNFSPNSPGLTYVAAYFLLVMAFSYFYVSITFNTDQVAENIQKRGGFIPGIRPGPETSVFLRKVSNNLNLWGGLFLGFVAIFPYLFNFVTSETGTGSVPILISGAGLIIIVGVVMEIISRINAELVMHDYDKLY